MLGEAALVESCHEMSWNSQDLWHKQRILGEQFENAWEVATAEASHLKHAWMRVTGCNPIC